jgi:hypothetical protein
MSHELDALRILRIDQREYLDHAQSCLGMHKVRQ